MYDNTTAGTSAHLQPTYLMRSLQTVGDLKVAICADEPVAPISVGGRTATKCLFGANDYNTS
jgi:hypothetical protein